MSTALCAAMERMTGEETAPRGYGDGAAGEFAAAVVLWSSAAWTEAGESGWGLRRHRRYPCSMIQDWKLTLVVAASPYVGYRVEDEELLRNIVRRGRVRLALF